MARSLEGDRVRDPSERRGAAALRAAPLRLSRAVLAAIALLAIVALGLGGASASAAPPPLAAGADAGLEGADASADSGASADADAAIDARIGRREALRREVDALEQLAQGRLAPGVSTTELFRVDLADEPSVLARVHALRAAIAARLDGGAPRAIDPVDADLDALTERADAARLAFLERPRDERAAILESEAELRRAAEERDRAQREGAEAERDRERALNDAVVSVEEGRRALAQERARATSVQVEHAALRARRADEKQARALREQARAAAILALRAASEGLPSGSTDLDAHYDAIVAEGASARDALRRALESYGHVERAGRYRPDRKLPVDGAPELEPEREALRELERRLDASADALDAEATAIAEQRVLVAVIRVHELHELHLAVLQRLAPDRRSELLGLGGQGFAHLHQELEYVALMGRTVWITRDAELAALRRWAVEPGTLVSLLARAIAFLALVAAARYAAQRRRALVGGLKAHLTRWLGRARAARGVSSLLDAVETVGGAALLVACVAVLPRWFSREARIGPVALSFALLSTFAFYRLAVQIALALIAVLAESPSTRGGLADGSLTQRSLRLAGRYFLGASVTLQVAETLVGRGYLFTLTRELAGLAAVPVAFVLLRRWRPVVVEAYRRLGLSGRLTDLVTATEGRWYGFFVALGALFVVAGRWLGRRARAFILSFDQSRKALAFLFRRRLERRAEGVREAVQRAPLPTAIAARLSEAEPAPPECRVNRFPELDAFVASYRAWMASEVCGAWLVVGKAGFGKTFWVDRAVSVVAPSEVVRVRFDARVLDAAGVDRALADALGLVPGGPSVAEALRDGARRLVVVDDLHQLCLRGVGTSGAWDAFHALVRATSRRVYWLATMDHYAHEYVAWSTGASGAFRHVTSLGRWSEGEIAELLRARVAVDGWSLAYDALAHIEEGEEIGDRLVTTEEEYLRLIWDYAEGSPRVAVRVFRRSLALRPGERRMHVHLFHRPDEPSLERLREPAKFALACVVWHASVTAEEAAESLQERTDVVAAALDELADDGVLERASERYRVSVEWWAPVVRYLHRKHLIVS